MNTSTASTTSELTGQTALVTGGTSGIGRQIWTWYNALDLPKVAAGIVIVGVVGLVLDTVLMRLAKAVAIDEGSPS